VSRVLAVLRSTPVRVGFLVLALALAVVAVARSWDDVVAALGRIDARAVVAALALTVGYVAATLLSWRAVLADLGSPLRLRDASPLFVVSQLGKYVPGGVWNVVAAAELGAGHRIPRRRSASAMAVAVLVSLVTGGVVASIAVVLAPTARDSYAWVVVLVPVLVALLVPAVLNRLLTWVLRVARREPLEHALTARGTGVAVGWSLVAWLAAGAQVWVLATAVGMPATGRTFALAVGGYALAWVVGFLVVVAPAGLGAREVVLAAVLAGQLDRGSVIAVVLLSRIATTVVDVAAGLGGLAALRPDTAGRRRGAA
jgi:uncharacterized membrane protein YbhN (UPF0104 family)